MYFIITDITSSRSQFIFQGENQYCRFHKSIKHQFDKQIETNHSVGTFRTHSVRKGAATHVSSGSTACPPYATVSKS